MGFKPLQELPKISELTSFLRTPEVQFEKMVKEATGTEIPEGPQAKILKFQQDFEGGEGELPEKLGLPKGPEEILAKLPKLPELPELPALPTLVEKEEKAAAPAPPEAPPTVVTGEGYILRDTTYPRGYRLRR